MIPKGSVNARKTKRRRSYSQAVGPGQEQEVAEYFTYVYSDYPEILTTDDIAAMTGLQKKSFWRMFQTGHIKYLVCGRRYFIPKVYFWEFVASRRLIDAWSNSDEFIRVLEGFVEWQSKKR